MRILVRSAAQRSLIEGAVLRAVEGVDAFVKRDPPEWTLDRTEGSCVVCVFSPNDGFHKAVQALHGAFYGHQGTGASSRSPRQNIDARAT